MVSDASPDARGTSSSRRQPNIHRVRKRTPNACSRCRRQKIRCTGSKPCDQCSKRELPCDYDDAHQKILVTRGFLSDLERQAGLSRNEASAGPREHLHNGDLGINDDPYPGARPNDAEASSSKADDEFLADASHSEVESASDSEPESARDTTEQGLFTNPLVAGSAYTTDVAGRPSWLGISSNWSFGRRILTMLHEKVVGGPLPSANLIFEGSTYDLGWDGCRGSVDLGSAALPTADFALFLINAVKFHCGQLFHLFDEETFMHQFGRYHDSNLVTGGRASLWYVHYLLILAIGKALIVRVSKERKPPGADLFVLAMKLMPDMNFCNPEPLQAMETLCCAALYLQCLDMRRAAYSLIGQTMRAAVVEGIHTDGQSQQHSESYLERSRQIWWTIYLLDCHMSSLMGTPLSLAEQDITAQLPRFASSTQKTLGLSLHVKLAKITVQILRTVYSEDGRVGHRFLNSMKTALRELAKVNDQRRTSFLLQLNDPAKSVSRISAYLHLFHHQCIILATRPLLYSFLQKRLEASGPTRISSTGGVRALIRLCVSSALQTLKILGALQYQSLLGMTVFEGIKAADCEADLRYQENFIPFDLESTWSAVLVLLVTRVVDPSLLKGKDRFMGTAQAILDEMAARGNLIAEFRKFELEQLDTKFDMLRPANDRPRSAMDSAADSLEVSSRGWGTGTHNGSASYLMDGGILREWNSEDGLSGEQLEELANTLDFSGLDQLWASPLDQLGAPLL